MYKDYGAKCAREKMCNYKVQKQMGNMSEVMSL